jgi:hypothetical protein
VVLSSQNSPCEKKMSFVLAKDFENGMYKAIGL